MKAEISVSRWAPFKRYGWGVFIGATTLAALAIAKFEPRDVDEATAAVAAAVIALAGTFAGHRAGHRRSSQAELAPPSQNPRHTTRRFYQPLCKIQRAGERLAESERGGVAIAFALVLLTAVVGVTAYLAVQRLFSSVSPAAAAAIFSATAGVAATRVAHERWLSLAERVGAGRVLFAFALAVSTALVFWPFIWHFAKVPPQDIAAFAAVLISVAGTFLAHSSGRRLSRL
jgi:hypothetical protein